MTVPHNYKRFNQRLNRFLSKDINEAENPTIAQAIANVQVTGDYSLTPVKFYIKPPVTLIYEITEIFIRITDSGNINPEEYISGAALTNGIKFEIRENGFLGNVNPLPIKTISDYISYVGPNVRPIDNVNNPSTYGIQWNLCGAGSSLFLNGQKEHSLCVIANDNFSSLTAHTAKIRGLIHSTDVNKR